MPPRAVGIDLGTTFSSMAWVNEAGKSTLIPNDQGDLITPSVVLFEDNAIVVGKEAKKVAVVSPDRVATCVKRDMGKPIYTRPIRGNYLPPEVIQSYILKKLKDDITRAIGPDFRAIITVPAYFDEPRRKATFQAGEMAGLKVLDILNEPTAAALAFGEDFGYLTRFGAPKEQVRTIVYDLGGGTFDVTLIDMKPGDLRTVCTDGDVQLGGFDWDMRLVDYMAEVFSHAHHVDPRQSPATLQRMLLLAEEVKHTLSARARATMHLTHDNRTCEITVNRELFEDRTADLLERTRYTTRQLLATAGLKWKDVGRILLTGGSTRMPMVRRMLKELSGIEPDMSVNPDEAVARGAAVYAGYLLASKGESGHAPTFDVTNVNAHSLGIEGLDTETHRKRNKILIPRNSTLPARKVTECVTKQVDQRTVVVQVLEGESLDPEECTRIGRTVIRDLPPNLPQGWPVEVCYEYGVNGRLNVRAKVRGTDREVTLELERDDSMSADRVNRWQRAVASSGGLDAFDLAIQQELDDLRHSAHRPPAAAPRPAAARPAAAAAAGDTPTQAFIPPAGGVFATPATPSAAAVSAAAMPAAAIPAASAAASTLAAPAAVAPAAPAPLRPQPAAHGGKAPLPLSPLPAGASKAAGHAPAALPAKPAPMPAKPSVKPREADLLDDEDDGPAWAGRLGYVLLALGTLVVSYYLLALVVPEANFLHLKLPGVRSVDTGSPAQPGEPASDPAAPPGPNPGGEEPDDA